MFKKIRSRQGRGQEDKDTSAKQEVVPNPFDQVDVVFGEDQQMEVYKKGEAPPQTANFPDLFGDEKTSPGSTEGENTDNTTAQKSVPVPDEVESKDERIKIPDIDPPVTKEKTPPTEPPPPPPPSPPAAPPPTTTTTTTTTTATTTISTNDSTNASLSQDNNNRTAGPPMMTMMSSTIRETVQSGVSNRTDFPLIGEKAHLLIIDIQKYLSHSDDVQSFYHGSLQTMLSQQSMLLNNEDSCR